MSFITPSYIRYFAETNDAPAGAAALEYLKSMFRIAPVRVVSMTGGLVGKWTQFSTLQFTPMGGSYVSAVCCHPSRWVWRARVPMTDEAARGEISKPTEYAEGTEELYTPKVRNVLFMVTAPITDEQHATAKRYDAVILPSLSIAETISARWPDQRFEAAIVPIPIDNHARIREAVTGAP